MNIHQSRDRLINQIVPHPFITQSGLSFNALLNNRCPELELNQGLQGEITAKIILFSSVPGEHQNLR